MLGVTHFDVVKEFGDFLRHMLMNDEGVEAGALSFLQLFFYLHYRRGMQFDAIDEALSL